MIKDKSEIFKRGKETAVELEQKINMLNEQIDILNATLDSEIVEKDKYINSTELYSKENRRLRAELATTKTELEEFHNGYKDKHKITKENADLKVEVRRLNSKLEALDETHEKEMKQQRINYEIKIDDLEEELRKVNNRYGDLENAEAVTQKLAYWKEKAKSEAKRAEKLEHDIIAHGDQTILSKLFGNK